MPTYSEQILRLAEINPTPIPVGSCSVTLANRLCGDSITVAPELKQGKIIALRWHVQGCVILKASAAYLAQKIQDREIAKVLAWIEEFKHSFDPAAQRIASPLDAVYALPARYKCALLPFEACENFLREYS